VWIKLAVLAISGRSEVQKYNLHDNSEIQLVRCGQFTTAEGGQYDRFLHYKHTYTNH
jgi:hypothetical protein